MRLKKHLLTLSLMLLASVLTTETVSATDTPVLVLPFETLGVEKLTADVARNILVQELEAHGLTVMSVSEQGNGAGLDPCGQVDCARNAATAFGADRVLYGTLSRLGGKVIAQVNVLDRTSGASVYSDRFSSSSTRDLDTVMLRIAEGIAAGRDNSDQATIMSVIDEETEEPLRRATKRGLTVRSGFIFPMDNSYGGADRLTSLQIGYKHEARNFVVMTTAITGIAWGDGAFEWTPLDVFVAKTFGDKDMSGYIGGGAGIRSVHVENFIEDHPDYGYPIYADQTETTLSVDVGVGVLAMRTFDFNLLVELRYHLVFEQFDEAGGDGAHGVVLSFGTGW